MRNPILFLICLALTLVATTAWGQHPLDAPPEEAEEPADQREDGEDDLGDLPTVMEKARAGITKLVAMEVLPVQLYAAPSMVLLTRTSNMGGTATGAMVGPDLIVASNLFAAWGSRVTATIQNDEEYEGTVINTDPTSGLVLIRLDAAPGDASYFSLDEHGTPSTTLGYDIAIGSPDQKKLIWFPTDVAEVTDRYGRILQLLPASFEGAAVTDNRGRLAGLVVGCSMPGAPTVRGVADIQALLDLPVPEPVDDVVVEPEKAKPVSWSLGIGAALAVPRSAPTFATISGRLDLFLFDRFSISAHGSYGSVWTDRTGTDVERFSLVPGKYVKGLVDGILTPYVGKLSGVAIGIPVGGGFMLSQRMIPDVKLGFGTCTPGLEDCRVVATVVETGGEIHWDPVVSLGIESTMLKEGPLESKRGFRVSYQFFLNFADFRPIPGILDGRSTHVISVHAHL